ncbi:hypothetical protein ACPPVS_00960 [Cellulomonas sp. McL0617]|uniref:hypothetical protein n=1 Tax=Cellulomonas sp. McL0617 TaxID=3415675 RepID=UPI003CF26EE2
MNSTNYEKPVRNTKVLGYISIALLVVFVVLAVFRISAVSDGESHPAIQYILVVGIVFSLIFFATLAVKFLFIGDDED